MLRRMTDKPHQKEATGTVSPKLKSDVKQARLSEALRANLRRRKEQARERKIPKPEASE